MDVLENILERIAQTQEQRDAYLKQAEVGGAEDRQVGVDVLPARRPGHAGVDAGRGGRPGGAERRGAAQRQQRRGGREALRRHAAGPRVRGGDGGGPPVHRPRHLHQEHRAHGAVDPKFQHPEFEKQRKASISLALTSMAKGGDLEVVKQGRGRESPCTAGRRANSHGHVQVLATRWGFPRRWPEFDGKRNVDVQTCAKCGAQRESPVQFGPVAPPADRQDAPRR